MCGLVKERRVGWTTAQNLRKGCTWSEGPRGLLLRLVGTHGFGEVAMGLARVVAGVAGFPLGHVAGSLQEVLLGCVPLEVLARPSSGHVHQSAGKANKQYVESAAAHSSQHRLHRLRHNHPCLHLLRN